MKKLISAFSIALLTIASAYAQSLVEFSIKQNPLFEVSTNEVRVAFDPAIGSLTIGGDIVVAGGSGSYSYHWYTPDGTDLGSDKTLTVTAYGDYRLDISDSCDCKQTVNFYVVDFAGIGNVTTETFRITPNPTTGYVEFDGIEIIQLTAVNMAGQLSALIDHDGRAFTNADLSHLSDGAYVVLATGTDGKTYSSKIIKK